MHASFFDMFGADIGISETTGYDWTHVSTEAQSETNTFKVEATVPPCKNFFLTVFLLEFENILQTFVKIKTFFYYYVYSSRYTATDIWS